MSSGGRYHAGDSASRAPPFLPQVEFQENKMKNHIAQITFKDHFGRGPHSAVPVRYQCRNTPQPIRGADQEIQLLRAPAMPAFRVALSALSACSFRCKSAFVESLSSLIFINNNSDKPRLRRVPGTALTLNNTEEPGTSSTVHLAAVGRRLGAGELGYGEAKTISAETGRQTRKAANATVSGAPSRAPLLPCAPPGDKDPKA